MLTKLSAVAEWREIVALRMFISKRRALCPAVVHSDSDVNCTTWRFLPVARTFRYPRAVGAARESSF